MSTSKLETPSRVGEVAAGTAADCMAVCCCCPWALMNLLILAVYRVPSSLCRKAWKKMKRRRLRKRKALLQQQARTGAADSDCYGDEGYSGGKPNVGVDDSLREAAELEQEMWELFDGAGFWRSESRRGRLIFEELNSVQTVGISYPELRGISIT